MGGLVHCLGNLPNKVLLVLDLVLVGVALLLRELALGGLFVLLQLRLLLGLEDLLHLLLVLLLKQKVVRILDARLLFDCLRSWVLGGDLVLQR